MSLSTMTSSEAIEQALEEFRVLGRAAFLEKYGFGKARQYFVDYDGRLYDSKAIIGAAHGFEFPTLGPLKSSEFSGGENTVVRKLKELGFSVVERQSPLLPGDVLNNTDIHEEFGVGNMGGMRRSHENNCLVLISDGTKSLYDDRWEGPILHYTGMGKSGDQTFSSQNRTLAESPQSDITVHLFEVFVPGQYVYVGEVDLESNPYFETQVGEDSESRQVIMFPLHLKVGATKPTPNQQALQGIESLRSKTLSNRSLKDLKNRAAKAKATPEKRIAQTVQMVRDAAVVAYVKKAAAGRCDLCGNDAPFKNKGGEPYLECHHVTRLADGGEDAIANAVALCANCHRKMHILNRSADKKTLLARIKDRDSGDPQISH